MTIAILGIALAFAAAVVASTLLMDAGEMKHTMPDGQTMEDEQMR